MRIASIVAVRQSATPTTNPEPVREKLTCPVCKGPLRSVEHGAWGGRRFHAELEVFDCPQHGAIYLTREGVPGPGPNGTASAGADDLPRPVPRRPSPAPRSGAVSLPEPDSD